jgi:hypothetical protein
MGTETKKGKIFVFLGSLLFNSYLLYFRRLAATASRTVRR